MPRQQSTRSSLHAEENHQLQKQQSQSQPLSEILGGDAEFADKFFGESPNMSRIIRSASPQADTDGDVTMNGETHQGPDTTTNNTTTTTTTNGVSDHNHVSKHVGNSAINIENTPQDIDCLIIRQLEEDLDSYRYDVDFCKAQLEPDAMAAITPAEARTFQLRILDLGHQMRSLHHRIQLMQASINNSRFVGVLATGRVGATTANAYYGPYPPGTSVQPGAYSSAAVAAASTPYGPSTPYDSRHGRPLLPASGYSSYPDAPQERRGPGRPLGSKNRTKLPSDPSQPVLPGNLGSAKAAALASAGAKRELPVEGQVATPNGKASPSATGHSTNNEKPSKRARVEGRDDSPLSTTNTEGENTDSNAVTSNNNGNDNSASTSDNENDSPESSKADDDTEEETEDTTAHVTAANATSKKSTHSALAAPNGTTPSTPILPAMSSADASFATSISSPSAGPTTGSGHRGGTYQRLGHWMCTLCTSQKYLQHPSPKQPAEPSSWPLRDISKIVTHFTRMHTEHDNVERCMELGSALAANAGPFKYWIEVTKKVQTDDEQIRLAIVELRRGNLPELLRKLSASAANFPRQQ